MSGGALNPGANCFFPLLLRGINEPVLSKRGWWVLRGGLGGIAEKFPREYWKGWEEGKSAFVGRETDGKRPTVLHIPKEEEGEIPISEIARSNPKETGKRLEVAIASCDMGPSHIFHQGEGERDSCQGNQKRKG